MFFFITTSNFWWWVTTIVHCSVFYMTDSLESTLKVTLVTLVTYCVLKILGFVIAAFCMDIDKIRYRGTIGRKFTNWSCVMDIVAVPAAVFAYYWALPSKFIPEHPVYSLVAFAIVFVLSWLDIEENMVYRMYRDQWFEVDGKTYYTDQFKNYHYPTQAEKEVIMRGGKLHKEFPEK